MSIPIIQHVQIAIPEGREDAARSFYHDILGFPEIPKPDHLKGRGGIWFRTGKIGLHLGVDRQFSPATKAHVAFLCRDFHELRTRLSQAGHAIVDDTPLPEFDRFYTVDPFGNRVELMAPRGGSS